MKRLFTIALILLVSSFLFAQTVLYKEGSVKVAGVGELPSGLFAKARGYLPGDTINLTNTISGREVKLLNLGSPEMYEGVVILVSKEAAEALGISKKDNLDIRIPDRKGNIEESVSGQGLLKKASAKSASLNHDDEYQDIDEDFDSYKLSLEKPSPAEILENGGQVSEKTPSKSGNGNIKDKDGEVIASNENIELEKIDDAYEEPEADLTIPANSYADSAEKVEDDSYYEITEDSDGEKVDSNENINGEASKNPVDNSVSEEKFDAEEIDPIIEKVPYTPESDKDGEGVSSNENVNGEKAERKVPYTPESDKDGEGVSSNENVNGEKEAERKVPYTPELDKEGEGVFSNERITGEKQPDPIVLEQVSLEDDFEEEYVPEEDKEGESVKKKENLIGEEYAPIILVPVEDKAPEHTEAVKEDVSKIVVEEVIVSKSSAEEIKNVKDDSIENDVIKNHVVSLESIKKSDYYVQIATLSDEDGIIEVIKKYKKYDIVLLRNSNGTYKVLVGPLTVDEYGAILKRFKSYGFKDAFLFRKK